MIKKSRAIVYIEFFQPQNMMILEDKLRRLQKDGYLPPFRQLTVMVDHKNLKNILSITKHPLVIKDDEIK